MIELATLGLLLQEPLHGYRLKQQLELLMSGCISVNYGTIYPLLRRLEQQEAIVTQSEPGAVGETHRKIYCLTPQGYQLWKQKMLEHPQESWVNACSRFMIKFCFFSHLSSIERGKLIEHRLMMCRLRLEQQQQELRPIDPYQATAKLKFIEFLEHEICWLQQQLEQVSQSQLAELAD